MAARMVWSDRATSTLLEALRDRESLWNTRNESYKNRTIKKKDYEEILEILKNDNFNVDLQTVKAKIQSLRTFYREELRKIKKSEGTGSGSNDIYVSNWKFFNECNFLEEVISSNRPACSNVADKTKVSTAKDDDFIDISEEVETKSESSVSVTSDNSEGHPKRRKRSSGSTDNPFLESAATALNRIAKGSSSDDDQWDVFGRDVAHSLRNLSDKDQQRRVKFAIQTAIFQSTEPVRRPTYPISTYNFQDEPYNYAHPS